MEIEERILLRKARWGLLAVTALFTIFGWATMQVEGFNIMSAALFMTAAFAAVTALWLTFHWKVVTVLVVTLAILAGGAIGAATDSSQVADAHTIQCTRPSVPRTWWSEFLWIQYEHCLLQKIQHLNWHIMMDMAECCRG